MGLFSKKPKTTQNTIAPILPADIYKMGVLELKDIIAPSALKITPRLIHLGEKVARTLFVISYPRFISDNWLSPIINIYKNSRIDASWEHFKGIQPKKCPH